MANWLKLGLPSAGLFAGPAAWLISTQANYALAPWTCEHGIQAVPILAVPLVVVSLAGGLLSWRAFKRQQNDDEAALPIPSRPRAASLGPIEGGRPHRLVAAIGVLIALLFAITIAVHGVAGLVFNGCER